jgi:predicted NBD/HSP70 family sugar kinase
MMGIRIFISCTHADWDLCRKLVEHLSSLKHSKDIIIWNDQEIPAGADREQQIDTYLCEAHLILLLVSPSFLSSKYCWNKVTQTALERRKSGAVQVIPVILKPVDWQHPPLGQLQALPAGTKPITEWGDQDAAFRDVTQGIRSVVETLQITRRNDLEDKEAPSEGDQLSATQKGRRKVVTIDARADSGYVIGVDIDRSHLAILLTDQHVTNIVELWSAPFDTNLGAEICLSRVAEELHAMVGRNGVTWEQVVGIGLATPGPLDPDSVRILSASRTMRSASQMPPDWEEILHIPDYLKHQLKLKKKIDILLGNDASMGALGVSRYGAWRGVANLAYVKIGMGIGAGLVIDHRLYLGSTNAAGEIGHLVAVTGEDAVKCVCGQSGCLETVAAEPAIVEAVRKGDPLHARDPNSHQTPRLAERRDIVGIRDVIQAAKDGDEISKAALENAAKWIATSALGALINIFNPSLILLDGDIVREYHGFVKVILKRINNSSLHANWAGLQHIEPCELPFPVAFGAAANIHDRISGAYQRKPKSHRAK